MSLYWPILLSVFSGVIYQFTSKSSPKAMDPLASLTVTYLVAAILAAGLYCVLHRKGNLLREYANLNWTSYVLGLAVIGIDLGNRYMYRAGWSLSSGYIVNSVLLSVVLLAVGYIAFKESVSWRQVLGVVFCLTGVGLITR